MPANCSTRKAENVSQRSGWKATCFAFVFCAAVTITAPAQTFTTLKNFDGTNGSFPNSPLVQGIDGNFYGTTGAGGSSEANCTSFFGVGECGTVFKITAKGALTTVYNFCAETGCTDGAYPHAGLIQTADGTLYGTTEFGGSIFGYCPQVASGDCGTVFKITPGGKETVLHTFLLADGSLPQASLVRGSSSNFYGTTSEGGGGPCGNYGCGTVFKIMPGGGFTSLCTFLAQGECQDLFGTAGTLIQGTDGNFYGTTIGYEPPGVSDCSVNLSLGCGHVFSITPSGALSILYAFCSQTNCADGATPNAPLLQGNDGNFYGTTSAGGANNAGEVFKITPAGSLTVLYSFCSQTNCTDGYAPFAGLVQGTDGNFYGTTTDASTGTGRGTIFQVTPAGKLTTIHTFSESGEPGPGPELSGSLIQGTDGSFYGVTTAGGTNNDGTVFRLSLGLGSFVEAQFNFGIVGSNVVILGSNLTGTTSVRFNGRTAAFTVVSDTEITATVPAGATTGKFGVTTPAGTLISNQKFHVMPQVFSISPTSGPVGTKVVITGDSFTQVGAVSLAYEWPMSFTVDSDTQITATIPDSGTTGDISIRTPGGIAHTTGKFTVTP